MRIAAAAWLLTATAALAQAAPAAPSATADAPRFRRSSGGIDAAPTPLDLSPDFDPFGPDNMPPPTEPRFDPRRPSLAAAADPLAALIRNGPSGAVLSRSQSPEPWMLPGGRRKPTLADPPPGSAPATRPLKPSAPAG